MTIKSLSVIVLPGRNITVHIHYRQAKINVNTYIFPITLLYCPVNVVFSVGTTFINVFTMFYQNTLGKMALLTTKTVLIYVISYIRVLEL